MIPQESGTEFLGNGEFPRNGVQNPRGIEKRNAQPSLLLRPEWNKIHLWGGVESLAEKQQGVVTI